MAPAYNWPDVPGSQGGRQQAPALFFQHHIQSWSPGRVQVLYDVTPLTSK